jgi:arylamine N-acetyltransferase
MAIVGTRGGRLGDDVRSAYLDRLGLERERPSAAALERLVHRQVERVPYETLWIAAGEAWDIDAFGAAERIALHGRGGYCYHLNGALALLLESLGYSVHRHVGGVHGPEGPNPDCTGNHLVLTVTGLPAESNPEGAWYVDTGLGDALYDPLPLAPGVYDQAPFRLSLEAPLPDTWHLSHDPTGGFTGMSWTSGAAAANDFIAQHQWLSTDPDSGFVRVPMAERRDATGIDVVRGLVLRRIGENASEGEVLSRRTDWFGALAEVFGLTFEHSEPEAVDRLWRDVVRRHEEHAANASS